MKVDVPYPGWLTRHDPRVFVYVCIAIFQGNNPVDRPTDAMFISINLLRLDSTSTGDQDRLRQAASHLHQATPTTMDPDTLRAILSAQAAAQEKMLQAVMKEMRGMFSSMTSTSSTAHATSAEFVTYSLSARLHEFTHDSEKGCTFDVWYSRYEDIITQDGATINEAAKARLIVSKLDAPAYARFTNHILPRKAAEISLAETMKTLQELFGHNTSPRISQEIDRLVAGKVLTPVEHSDWAALVVVVQKKNGSIRLCADFSTGLNDALEQHQHPLPAPDDIFAKLNGGRYFSQLDLAEAYLQIEMGEESRQLLTINTHRGLYRLNRLSFGVKATQLSPRDSF
ncbi:unnamed protein product [Haemonchus placei]|uniref:Reverse transcriptase domain-containing protein n=1 Tax=Haemonchus placei TaxID=6290 RepID=A0A0N4WY23_HAEPC|nr:unnamed protein product [Haemonchus placei]